MKFKKVVAITLSMAMVLGCSMTAFAEEESTESPATGTSGGDGKVESYVDTDVFAVVLPTDDATIYNFIVDPQGLINATDAAAYTGYTFEEDATLFFANTAADGTVSYSSSSDALTVTNKSTMPVAVEVVATYTSDSIGITDDADFTDDDSTDVYLALVGGDADAETFDVNETKKATVSTKMDCVEDGSYAFTYDSDTTTYSYKLTDTEGNFDTYSFYLTGASNSNADWSAVTAATASVSVTYTLTESEYEGTAPTFIVNSSDSSTIDYTVGEGDYALVSITSITVTNANGKTFDGYNAYGTTWSAAADTGDSITFDSKFATCYTATTSGYTATVTYVNALGKTVTDTVDGVFASN